MLSFRRIIASLEAEGYANGPAQAKLAHDVILKALETCGFGKNVTVKGGVVMSTITGDIRRATMDMDIDFVNYSLSNVKIDALVKKLNCIEGVSVARQGAIVELRQQHYRGKRIFLRISDAEKVTVVTKIDIGVHTYAEMLQRNLKFDIVLDMKGAKLPANSKEQIFAEKLKSLLKFGVRSNRPKDAFDMYYLIDGINKTKFRAFVKLLVFDDMKMRERDFASIAKRLERVLLSATYMRKLVGSKANWLQVDPQTVARRILNFLGEM